MSLTNIFENDAGALKVSDDQVTGIAALARRAKTLEKEIAEIEETLNERAEQYRKLTEQTIPEAMAETGMKKFVMEDGSMIDIKPYYGASIPKARQAEAFQWLRDHGFDDIIKNTISVRFGRGEDELSVRLLNLLGTQGYPAEQAQKIEPQTLKAWVKERVEKGEVVDTELFGVFIGQKAVIKSN
tara:strand:+ start:1616 stop:2170 length:555 start_codon:yes stop_codon:yes gene_type:complete